MCRGSNGIAPLIVNVDTIRRSEFSVMRRPSYRLTNSAVSKWRLVVPHRRFGGGRFLGCTALNIVTILTDLSLPFYTGVYNTCEVQILEIRYWNNKTCGVSKGE